MSSPLSKLLQVTPTNTLVKELMINGEDVSRVQRFVKYDKFRDLAYFTNDSGSTFICIGERIDMIEFTTEEEQKNSKENPPKSWLF
ncbi:hypothetical protein WQ54_13265 [Bacillus sp. SA1-12]|uniref:hypothetical protein n=1 Tax=Bacillus sp. SA1-12 TaxID=1455638 RepID=UPI000626B573|nr:hypothetical protein [Bacillus sp. SA1-12]KKI91685.1 hypothetical protein WQ54_13265 [Bacillus sp. SA1-12]